ncbi:MAG: AMP-binding protein [Blastomonas sp.]
MNASLYAAIANTAAASPDTPYIVKSEVNPANTRLGEVFAAGQRTGTRFAAMGIRPGDVVAVMLPNWREWLVSAIGCWHAGAVMLPIVTIYGAKEAAFILRQSGARAIIHPGIWRNTDFGQRIADCGPLERLEWIFGCGDEFAALEAEGPVLAPQERDADDLAMLIYTSGTTADPKGVMHSSRSLMAEIRQQQESRARPAPGEGTDIIFSPWPPGHIAGALSMLRHAVTGISFLGMEQWDAGLAAELIERHRVTSSSGTPFHLGGIIEAADRDGRDLSSLRHYMVGAAPVPPSLVQRCIDRGLAVFHCYGSSEHPTVTTGTADDPLDKQLNTEGRVFPGCELRFVNDDGADVGAGEDGEICTRGPELFTGYFDRRLNDAAFLPGGWYRTGDIGRLDAEGYLLITDRKKDIIIRGGENISSKEVEAVLLRHPAIADAAAIACPDDRMGEVVMACVVLRSDATLDLASVIRHFQDAGIARQKTPERLRVMDELPRNASGKVLKHVLRREIVPA